VKTEFTAKKQTFSKLTPVYTSTKRVHSAASSGTIVKNIEFTHHAHALKKHRITHRRIANHPEKLILNLVEANIEDIDLDITNGSFSVPSEANSLKNYFDVEPESISMDAPSDLHHSVFKKQIKYAGRILVAVLLAGAVGLWGYLLHDTSGRQQTNALTLGVSNVNPVVDDTSAYIPKVLTISKLGIHATVDPVSTTAAGAMGVPENIWNAGWYSGSAKPGQPGAVFMDGHASSTRGALFGNLDSLVIGDEMQVERADGRVISYKVAKVSVLNRNDVNMIEAMQPLDSQKGGLNIMSCVGQWVSAENTLENRVLIYAIQL
jgi:LPXTG-site transpeptidase (sortase) family protein